MAQLAAILNETAPNPPYLVAYQLTTTDAHGTIAGAAPLKVVPTDDPVHPYLVPYELTRDRSCEESGGGRGW